MEVVREGKESFEQALCRESWSGGPGVMLK